MTTALIGVMGALVGTIVGSLLTQALQRRNAAYARLHEARLEAYQAFTAAVMNFRKALLDRWFTEHERRSDADSQEVYAMRSAVWAAYYQVMLVAGDPEIVRRAQQARDVASSLKDTTTRAELNERGDACRAAVGEFAVAARHELALIGSKKRRRTAELPAA
ncbi:hypothetical protein [Saccharothrix variisporea]|uniref:hypothetical protein n=1 Tax=Saccharothrix variisporea TaxID=543527 RepID=UPI000EB53E4D|nr:hypothetical protein [Saccharothrix variisporea]